MIAFLTLIYIAAIVIIFKVLKVKPTPWPIAIMVVVGVLMIGTVTVLWTIAAPISTKAVVTRYVVQIVPYSKGQVISIPAKPNVPLKKGDVLYKIDPTPYQLTVDQVKSQLQGAKSNILQLEAGVRVAEANSAKAKADVTAKKAAFDVTVSINKQNPLAISQLKLVEAREQYAASQAAQEQAAAGVEQAQSALTAGQDAVQTVEAQLKSAEFDLDQCTVVAPADGFVTDWQIREGTYVVPMPFAAACSFVETSLTTVVAPLPGQMLVHVKPGQEVEMAFKSRPGQLYLGKVDTVIQATSEGQFTTSGKLPSAASIGSPGILAVVIRFNDDQQVDEIEMGTAGSVAIYTDWGKSLSMISKVTIRMKKWLYFLPVPG
ncbi:efflux RND transporter periplasmic adaptor subunit [Rubripirellula amarantea]|nr:efflux RND transporter periplasmic adaptor subunit [Rubripirellula amarantea]